MSANRMSSFSSSWATILPLRCVQSVQRQRVSYVGSFEAGDGSSLAVEREVDEASVRSKVRTWGQ